MTWKDGFYIALLKLLHANGIEAIEVTSFVEDLVTEGYCETCSYERVVVEIYYKTNDSTNNYYVYEGDFASLIQELTD